MFNSKMLYLNLFEEDRISIHKTIAKGKWKIDMETVVSKAIRDKISHIGNDSDLNSTQGNLVLRNLDCRRKLI